MGDVETKIEAKLRSLISESQSLVKADEHTFYSKIAGWNVSVEHMVDTVFGKDSVYHWRFKAALEEANVGLRLRNMNCIAILESALQTFTEGWLTDLREQVRGELTVDYLDQAKQLVNEKGGHIAGVALSGAVLESTLRKMCDYHVPSLAYVPGKANLNTLIDLLAADGTVDKTQAKWLRTHADIRNNADHGNFDQVKPDDAKDMVNWVARFVRDH